jgi:hypothetical protein
MLRGEASISIKALQLTAIPLRFRFRQQVSAALGLRGNKQNP